ncbi:MAG: hypothetical protein DBX53_02595 [Clostridiales bacterium]|jgi:metallophosphoesterase|nr:MAG: hypothetical protein DBX53_02595 [Clostridiales bacterium]
MKLKYKTPAFLLVWAVMISFSACGEKKSLGSHLGEDIMASITKDESGVSDFIYTIGSEKTSFKILQLTDTQIIDLAQADPDTLRPQQLQNAFYGDGIMDLERRVWRYMRDIVERAKPDLIIITGDVIYGETDDSGEVWKQLISVMDSFQIPWGFCFGNHDNESAKGVQWQVDTAMAAEYCCFAQGNVTGNSNYNILIEQEGEPLFNLFLLDTNGCTEIDNPGEGLDPDNVDYDLIQQTQGIYEDQIAWYTETAEAVNAAAGKTVPSLAFFHIPVYALHEAMEEKYGPNAGLPLETDQDGDFGKAVNDTAGDCVDRENVFFNAAKEAGTIGMFMGHLHRNSCSVVWEGIRMTMGLKTGTDTFYNEDSLGGTLITLDCETGAMDVAHLYQDYLSE